MTYEKRNALRTHPPYTIYGDLETLGPAHEFSEHGRFRY